jgi:hypothetical protein
MAHPLAPLALLALAAPLTGGIGTPAPGPAVAPVELAQLTIRQRVIIRIPKMQSPAPAARMPIPVPPRWKEKRGPKCVAAKTLAGAMISQPGSVDLILIGGDRVRAVLDDDCGPIDFYDGYYLRPAADGDICAGRDVIRVRSGARCMIDRFRRLVPKP